MVKKSEELAALGSLLGQCVIGGGKQAATSVLSMVDLLQKWPNIVGDMLAEKAFPTRLQSGTLTLQTVSTVWANELQLLVPRLIDEIGEQCPQLDIQKIRFTS